MKSVIGLILAVLMGSSDLLAQQYFYKCGDPDNAMSPIVDVKVSFDKKTNLYSYKYNITSMPNSLVPIGYIYLYTFTNPMEIKSNKNWELVRYSSNKVFWASKTEGLKYTLEKPGNIYDLYPGKSIEGFEFKSPYPPGPVKISFKGNPINLNEIVDKNGKEIDNIHQILSKDEVEKIIQEGVKNCPGYFDASLDVDNPRDYDLIQVTTGPIPPTRVAAKLRMRKITEKKWRGSCESEPDIEVLPIDTGKIQLMLFGSRDVDVTKIDLGSLRFGQGRAKPVKTVIVNDFRDKDGEVDDDIKEHIKKNNVQHLLMEFNLDDVDIRCDSDRALFLDGKIEGKDLFGAVKIKHGSCLDKKNNAKEIKKAKEYELKNNAKSEKRKKRY